MQKFKVIQFLPYFPPHKGGVETVAEEWGKYFVKYGYGEVLNVIFSVGQETSDFEYTKNGCRVVIIPAFDLINNFPFPKFWTSGFWKALRAARDFNADIIQTHTRFFLSSLLGGAFAKWYKKKWVHVEHGSGYVVSDSALVRIFSKISDRTLGWWILKFSNTIVGISAACADFIQCEYGRTDTKVIYRGLECEIIPRPENPNNAIVRLAFAGRLVALKWVNYLLEVLQKLHTKGIHNFHLTIAWEGEKRQELESFVIQNKLEEYITFVGPKKHSEVIKDILPNTDILMNPSLQEWLPTSVFEGLMAGCRVIATDVGGTHEVHGWEWLILVPPADVEALAAAIESQLSETTGYRPEKTQENLKKQFDAWECMKRYGEVFSSLLEKVWKK